MSRWTMDAIPISVWDESIAARLFRMIYGENGSVRQAFAFPKPGRTGHRFILFAGLGGVKSARKDDPHCGCGRELSGRRGRLVRIVIASIQSAYGNISSFCEPKIKV